MMLRELKAWMKRGDFVYKTDVYSCYASINHGILFKQLKSISWPLRFFETIIAYCERTILRIGSSIHSTIGIPKGGSLSPVLGALYLTPLDHTMERWLERGDCFYARFQDDIILVSRKRHVLKRMKKEMHVILTNLRLSLRPEKTFVGRSQKGFDLLGYHITPYAFSPSQKTQEKALENAKRRYAQGGNSALAKYLDRWRTWVHAGLPFKIDHVEEVIDSIRNIVMQNQCFNITKNQRCMRSSRSSSDKRLLAELVLLSNRLVRCSETNRTNNKLKGISSWLKNFSGHFS